MEQAVDMGRGTIASRFIANVTAHADTTALRARQPDGSYLELSYREYADQVARCAAGLSALGFGPGQRLLLMLRNRPEFHILDMAAYFLGGSTVSIYNSSSPEQIQYFAEHCEASLAVADDAELLGRFQAVAARSKRLERLGVLGDAVPPGIFGWQTLTESESLNLEHAAHTAKPDDVATLIYTSGTTGAPKAVMLTHRTIVWTSDCLNSRLARHPRLPAGFTGLRGVSYLPMAHIAERMTGHYVPALFAAPITCCPDPAHIGLYLREVRPHTFFGVPRVWEKLYAGVQAAVGADHEKAQKLADAVAAARQLAEKVHSDTATAQERATYQQLDDAIFKNLRKLIGLDEALVALTGAAPLPSDMQLWFRAIGVPLTEVYGMSECCGPMTWSPCAHKPGTVGSTLPGVEIKLADDGEILCRGGNVFGGYLNAPAQTAAVLDPDGWLHSGDIGTFDEDGYLRIIDRKKELIITAGGDNISPANLEAALKTIPLIGQACVIGDTRPYISALLVLEPDVTRTWARQRNIADNELAALARHPELLAEVEAGVDLVMRNFGRVERVKRFVILSCDWLPDSDELTPTAKLKRRSIQAKYQAEIDALYGTTLAPVAKGRPAAAKEASDRR